ncbi:MAG: hypothetical protein KC414_13655, partial [Romboutsia sp.]|nr:hypothetical protein [Romboutsia sp.]
MTNKVAITGIGIISSIGDEINTVTKSLFESKTGLSLVENFDSIYSKIYPCGEIKISSIDLAKSLQINKSNFSRSSLLGAYAARQAISDSKINDLNKYRTGFISSTSVAGMDITEKYFNNFEIDDCKNYVENNNPGDITSQIVDFINFTGFTSTISTACSSSANAILFGMKLINSNYLDRVIVGGTDCLTKFTLNGFRSLMILSDEECKPFDHNRKGLNLGEGAGYLVMESEKILANEKKEIYAYIEGGANIN